MKTIIVILILLAFLQTTVISLNLGLILILVRAFIRPDKTNLYLAFVLGILLSLLESIQLGVMSLAFIILVQLIYLWNKTTFSRSFWTILPVVGILLGVSEFILRKNPIWPSIIWELVIILPIYIAVKFWEERFIVHRDIKLRI